MTNRVDFYQSEQRSLAAAGASVCVFAEGRLCSQLEVKKITKAGVPEFSSAEIVFYPAGDNGLKEEVERNCAIGKRIRVVRFIKSRIEPRTVKSFVVFAGKIQAIEREIGTKGEAVKFLVRDAGSELEKATIYGRYCARADGSMIFLPGSDTIFNEDSKANASGQLLMQNGRQIRVFAANERGGKFWSYAEVIEYLLSMYLPAGILQLQPLERLLSITEGQKVYDFDLTGLSLAEALGRCCEKTGLGMKIVPRQNDAGSDQTIVFYKKGFGRKVEINLQKAGEQISTSKTDVFEIRSRRFSTVTERFIGQGDFKIFEATFELVKGWDSSLEETNYDLFSPTTNPDFIKVKDVYRKWVLNEAGDYGDEPFNRGQAFDFTQVFGTGDFVQKRRRFWPAITCDANGKSLGYFLEVSLDGENWQQYGGAFENRTDECAIWLSGNRLDVETWVAALKGVLRFRITAAVVSDERISVSLSDGAVNSIAEVREHILTMPSRFKFRKVTAKSIFAGRADLCKDETDDTEVLYEYVRSAAKASARIEANYEVGTIELTMDYDAGDVVVSSPESRDLFIRDNRTINVIEQVEMDFDKQRTKLKITGYKKVCL